MLDNLPRGTICIEDIEMGMTRHLRKVVTDEDIETDFRALVRRNRSEALEALGRLEAELRPEFAAAHRILCASLAQGGKQNEVKCAMDRLYKVQPNVSLSWIEKYVPYTPRAMPHFLEGMRKAGLPA